MDVENNSVPEVDISYDSGKDLNSDDEVEIIPVTTPSTKTPCTPVNGDSKSPKTPNTASKKRKRLSSKEREERERDRQEKRAKLEEEKQKREEERQKREEEKQKREEERKAKLLQKEEERLKREEEKKKKQEEDEKRKKDKEEEKRIKEEEKKKKLEEEEKRKKEKEEERLKKLEEKEQERIKREQEKQQKLEEKEREKKKDEEKIAKQAKLFQNFFQKSPATPKLQSPAQVRKGQQNSALSAFDSTSNSFINPDTNQNSNIFKPMMFEVKSNMGLAPITRRSKLSSEEVQTFDLQCLHDDTLDSKTEVVENKDEPMDIDTNQKENELRVSNNYLLHLKQNGGRKYSRTDLPSEQEIQIISNTIIENPKDQGLVKWRYKLLQFCENQRPAYWGTWKKLSTVVKSRRPLAQEKEIDYDFDSDEEWEEEPEDAEDLANSDKEDDRENDSEEDDEDGWLVPHGYVSDDEGANDEHLDKEDLKIKEKDYFDGLKKQIKIQLPEIQTDRFSEYRIIFSPLRKKWKETCAAAAIQAATAATSNPGGVENVIEIAE